jgi:hypothetical protein
MTEINAKSSAEETESYTNLPFTIRDQFLILRAFLPTVIFIMQVVALFKYNENSQQDA